MKIVDILNNEDDNKTIEMFGKTWKVGKFWHRTYEEICNEINCDRIYIQLFRCTDNVFLKDKINIRMFMPNDDSVYFEKWFENIDSDNINDLENCIKEHFSSQIKDLQDTMNYICGKGN